MKNLTTIFQTAGCQHVRTYIQSGNVVFDARIDSTDRFVNAIGTSIESEFGFRPAIRLLSAKFLRAVIMNNPYPKATSEPASLHVVFLGGPPDAEGVEKLDQLLSGSESYTLTDSLLYLHAPDGIARSKFAASIDRVLRVQSTARNWRTITALEKLGSA